MSRFLRRRFPFTRGRQQALFDIVRKRGTNWALTWQRNQRKNETFRLNLKEISFVVRCLYDETNRAWIAL